MKPIDTLSDDELAGLVQRAVALPDAPAELVRAAIDLWPQATPAASPSDVAEAAWRLLVAALSFDSWATPPVALGVRAAAASDTRHLLYTTQGRDIDVRITPTADVFCISGQVLGPDTAGSVELVTHPDARARGTHAVLLNHLGEFRLDGVRQGTYRMTLRTGGDQIVLPPIVVGPRPQ